MPLEQDISVIIQGVLTGLVTLVLVGLGVRLIVKLLVTRMRRDSQKEVEDEYGRRITNRGA